jgi:hypothetical protein
MESNKVVNVVQVDSDWGSDSISIGIVGGLLLLRLYGFLLVVNWDSVYLFEHKDHLPGLLILSDSWSFSIDLAVFVWLRLLLLRTITRHHLDKSKSLSWVITLLVLLLGLGRMVTLKLCISVDIKKSWHLLSKVSVLSKLALLMNLIPMEREFKSQHLITCK